MTISSKHDEQAGIAGEPHEGCQQLEAVVDFGIVDDGAHAQRLPRLGLGGYSPRSQRSAAAFSDLVAVLAAAPIGLQDGRIVVAADMLLQLRQPLVDDLLDRCLCCSRRRARTR